MLSNNTLRGSQTPSGRNASTLDKVVPRLLGWSVGIVFFWFGFLKLFPLSSPAEAIAGATIETLTFGIVQPDISLVALAAAEMILGMMLGLGIYRRVMAPIAAVHIAFTFSPMLIFPDQTFGNSFLEFTLLGQYIFKNLVILGALVAIYRDDAQAVHKSPLNRDARGNVIIERLQHPLA